MRESREIELDGHIIDSGIMEHVLDSILDMGGDFEILEFTVGKRKTDTSYARVIVIGMDGENLDSIISTLHRHGARLVDSEDVTLVQAEGNRIVPKGFYSTTNYPTQVRIGDEWIHVDNIEMDCLIMVSPDKRSARAIPMSKLEKGDLVVVGERGVKIKPPERSRSHEVFSLWVV